MEKYFLCSGNKWKIRDDIRAMVSFKKMNLLQPFDDLGRFDIILCRNVGVYFNLENRKKLFAKIADTLEQDGYLIIGATIVVMSLVSVFHRAGPVVTKSLV